MSEFGMHEAKTKLSQLVERAEAGEDIVVTRNGKPAVRLVPISKKSFKDAWGLWRDEEIWIADDFDELPDDIADAFGAR